MKIVCSKSDLLKGVQTVSKAVPTNTTMSILECILIDARENRIKLIANDTELGIETIVEGTIQEKGMIALESKMMLDVVRNLPDYEDEVIIETNISSKTHIYCGKSDLSINEKPGDDFTFLPDIEKNESIDISEFTLKELIRQTIFSIGNSDSNKIMSGIHMSIKNDQLKVTSLDGHRISIRKVQLKNIYPEQEVIIPGKTLGEISKILTGNDDDIVNIYLQKSHVLFEFENTKVVSRLIEGSYFNVSKMMSSDYETKISVKKKDFYDCIVRSMLYSKEGNKKPIVIKIEESILNISVDSPLGGLNEDIDITKKGNDIRIGFNPKFISDALKVIDDEMIDIYFMNSKAPCYIKDENEKYIYMILPVNLNS